MKRMYISMFLVSMAAWAIAGFLLHPIVGWIVVALIALLFSASAYKVAEDEAKEAREARRD